MAEHRRLLAVYLGPQHKHLVILAMLSLAGIALQLFDPQVIRYFVAGRFGSPGRWPGRPGIAVAPRVFYG